MSEVATLLLGTHDARGVGHDDGPPEATAAEVRVRQWLARELHDTAAQVLVGMLIEMDRFKAEQFDRHSVIDEVDQLQASTRTVLANLRRTMQVLRGPTVQAPGLREWLPALLKTFQAQTGIQARVVGARSWPSPLSTHAAINVCRIIEETLQNIRLYSRANKVLISFTTAAGIARLRIRDDGNGGYAAATPLPGMGTLGMRERARLLGGELRIVSAPGRGTRVAVDLLVEALI